ncbi:jg23209 [Pararge aegeria aegeria]|uniref:Jg23209 protein n=1 Tax=Pararge aegeria aegeria TaxID=348720 RepID=A0A8S4RYG9_9NEOP|nr:jg23209 [Pararge aegeria aegeria]
MPYVPDIWHITQLLPYQQIASLFNICSHLIIVYILTGGYQCEISKASLRAVQWSWLEPVLLIINFGAHGFYSFPLIFNYHQTQSIQYLPIVENNAPCYPAMSHVDTNEIMYFLINVLWLKFTTSFITAVHEKTPGPMVTFSAATAVKAVIQFVNFGVQSSYNNGLLDILYKIVDVCLIILFLIIIIEYTKELKKQKNSKLSPALVENLLDGFKAQAEKKMGKPFVLDEKTTSLEESKQKF